jgi:hypothetical protein
MDWWQGQKKIGRSFPLSDAFFSPKRLLPVLSALPELSLRSSTQQTSTKITLTMSAQQMTPNTQHSSSTNLAQESSSTIQ